MITTKIRPLLARISSKRPAEDSGAVAVIVAVCMFFLLALAAIAIDLARIYVEAERIQKAADAAALAGVTYMPQDLPSAQQAARDAATRNGFAPTGSVVLTAQPGPKPSQLEVTISSTIDNGFAGIFGNSTATVTRQATADFQGPVPMGSPCNTFGQEPTTNSPGPWTLQPAGSALSLSAPESCRNPKMWANIQGPSANKVYGDRFMNRECSGTDGCSGGVNTEFDPEGYFFSIKVADPAATGPIKVQLYDPAYIDTKMNCADMPPTYRWILGIFKVDNMLQVMNNYTHDGKSRYDDDSDGHGNVFCSGDYSFGDGEGAMATSFALRAPTDTLDPKLAPVLPQCVSQFRGSHTTPDLDDLKKTNEMTRVFHQWVTLCEIYPVKGEYYLQVRSNVKLPGGMSSSQWIAGTQSGGTVPANPAVATQTGDDTSVQTSGNNAFAIRVVSNNSAKVSVAGFERMPLSMNAWDMQTSTFNLMKVMPGAAGKVVEFTFFDAADTASGGTLAIQRPLDATGSIASATNPKNCTAPTNEGPVRGNLTNCSVPVSESTHNGRLQKMYIPIPSDYSCNYSDPNGCWFTVKYNLTGVTTPEETTTWTAKLLGDPVRIVR